MISYQFSEDEFHTVQRAAGQIEFAAGLVESMRLEEHLMSMRASAMTAFLDALLEPLRQVLDQAAARSKAMRNAHGEGVVTAWELRCMLEAMRDGPARIGTETTVQLSQRLGELAPHDDDMGEVFQLWADLMVRAGGSGVVSSDKAAELPRAPTALPEDAASAEVVIQLVDAAISQRKLLPAQRDWALGLARSSFQELRDYLDSACAIPGIGDVTP